jgi:hypothetical protein
MKLLKNKAVKTGKIEITSEGSSLAPPYGHPNVATTYFHYFICYMLFQIHFKPKCKRLRLKTIRANEIIALEMCKKQ